MKIIEPKEIIEAIDFRADLENMMVSQKSAFIDFSAGLYDVPLPMQFIFPKYHSDSHIKSGYRQGHPYFFLKIASSGPAGLSGNLFVFSADTGELKVILQDAGLLTTLRTAIAGLIVSTLIPWQTKNIGIIGSGHLAKMLYDLLRVKYPDMPILLYARNPLKAQNITDNISYSAVELLKQCDLVFTATAAQTPLVQDFGLQQQAIIALGSDDPHKSELSTTLYAKSELIIIDSKQQALILGDIAKALSSKIISTDAVIALGDILQSGISKDVRRVIADFSGIGAQDVAIVEFILSKLTAKT